MKPTSIYVCRLWWEKLVAAMSLIIPLASGPGLAFGLVTLEFGILAAVVATAMPGGVLDNQNAASICWHLRQGDAFIISDPKI
jgi:hypothetical protein